MADLDIIVDPEEEIVVEGIDAPEADPSVITEDSLAAQLEKMKARAEQAEASRHASEQIAAEREAEAKRLREESQRTRADLGNSQVQVIANAIAANEGDRANLRARLVDANRNGDYETAADLQVEISSIAAKLQRLAEGKAALESQQEQLRERTQQQAADPVEAYVQNMSPRSAGWIRSHRDAITDDGKRKTLERAHYKALGNGISPDTDAYYDLIETEMGYKARPVVQQEQREEPVQQRQAAAPAAPVSRNVVSTATGRTQTTIRLTASQREAARMSGLSDTEYARELIKIQREAAR